jgi:hypothetical protein
MQWTLDTLQTGLGRQARQELQGMTGRLAKLHNFGSELQGTAQCAQGIRDPHFPVVNFRNITAVVRRARYRGANHGSGYQQPSFLVWRRKEQRAGRNQHVTRRQGLKRYHRKTRL